MASEFDMRKLVAAGMTHGALRCVRDLLRKGKTEQALRSAEEMLAEIEVIIVPLIKQFEPPHPTQDER